MLYRNILLIDDDVEDQDIFKMALSRVSEELTCEAYTNAREALEKLEGKELNPDLIFLDLNMPIMSGQEFLMEVKKKNDIRDIPVIIFSTSANPTTIKLTKDMGAVNFITKPDRFDALVNILQPIIVSLEKPANE